MNASTEDFATRPLPPVESPAGLKPPRSETKTLDQVIQGLVGHFQSERMSSGDLANLRRLDPRRDQVTSSGSFWRIVTNHLEPSGLLDGYAEGMVLRRWMAILQGLALVYDLKKGQPLRLGQAMARADISEARLIRLLRAGDDSLLAQVRPIAHQLRSAAQPVRWADVARLVLSEDSAQVLRKIVPHPDTVRQHIASDFYRQESQKSAQDDA